MSMMEPTRTIREDMNGKQMVVGAAMAEDVITQQPLMIAPRLPSGLKVVWLHFELCQRGLQCDEGLI